MEENEERVKEINDFFKKNHLKLGLLARNMGYNSSYISRVLNARVIPNDKFLNLLELSIQKYFVTLQKNIEEFLKKENLSS